MYKWDKEDGDLIHDIRGEVKVDEINGYDWLGVEPMKYGKMVATPIIEAPDSGHILHLSGGVVKWGIHPKMEGRPCSIRVHHCDGRIIMVEEFRSEMGAIISKEKMEL